MNKPSTYQEYLAQLEEQYGPDVVKEMIAQLEEDLGSNGWDLFTGGELELIDQYIPQQRE